MRGARAVIRTYRSLTRIIPAYAGSTICKCHFSPSSGDHPRVCGEHETVEVPIFDKSGSSPRMRGAPRATTAKWTYLRIIPAYAGSTYPWAVSRRAVWDHPRVCGEHYIAPQRPGLRVGSSPRLRGARAKISNHHHVYRIIPAYAGSTTYTGATRPRCRDHPRVCGEHTFRYESYSSDWGSSPRMRGAQQEPFL